MKQSAGLLLFRLTNERLEFFLVHPGGPFFARKEEGFWTVPKGVLDEGENPLHAAIREFEEETGFKPQGQFIELAPIIQKGGKKVMCWALQGDANPEHLKSNLFEMEWPPRSGKMKSFPEIDRAAWFSYEEAARYINEKQIPFLLEIMQKAKLKE